MSSDQSNTNVIPGNFPRATTPAQPELPEDSDDPTILTLREVRELQNDDELSRLIRQKNFLKQLREHYSAGRAAKEAGVGYKTVYAWRSRYPWFDQAWKDCQREAVDALETSTYKRAFSDTTLSIFMLKKLNPEVYEDRIKQEVTSTVHMTIEDNAAKTKLAVLNMIQSLINAGYSLELAMSKTSELGVPMEHLQLVSADDLDLTPILDIEGTTV